jgi:large subunit ribosomal protein L4
MVSVKTYDVASAKSGEAQLDLALTERPLYRTMKDAVVMYQSNKRQGDAHTKVRTELAGHKKKPWKQKKTGRARAGDRRSPLWVGGATVFGPRNTRRWTYHLPQRQRLVALGSALLGKLADGEVHVASGLSFDKPSAKSAQAVVDGCGMTGSVLVMLKEQDETLWKSFRNLARVDVKPASDVNAHDLLAHKWVLAEEGALEVLSARLPEVNA